MPHQVPSLEEHQELEGTVDALETKVQAVADRIEEINDAASQLATNLTAGLNSLDEVKTKIEELAAKVDGTGPDGGNGDAGAPGGPGEPPTTEPPTPEPPVTEPPSVEPQPMTLRTRIVASPRDWLQSVAERQPGDLNWMEDGVYPPVKFNAPRVSAEVMGTAAHPIIWRAKNGRGRVVVRGERSDKPPVEIKAGDELAFYHLGFEGIGSGNDASAGVLATHDVNTGAGIGYRPQDFVKRVYLIGCDVTGRGKDGIKFATARQIAIVGCRVVSPQIDQEGIDGVTLHSALIAYNEVVAGGKTALTVKLGARRGWVHHNILRTKQGYTGSTCGGHGKSYVNRPFPDGLLGAHHTTGVWEWNWCRGTGNHGLFLAGAQNCTVRNSWIPGGIHEEPGKSAAEPWPSVGNTIENIWERDPTPDELATIGPDALPDDYLDLAKLRAQIPPIDDSWR